jgi:hypothetical protein
MMPPPPPPKPPKKRSPWLVVGILAAIVIVWAIANNATHSTSSSPQPTSVTQPTATPTDTPLPTFGITPVPTDTPAPPPKWTTTQNFTGSGIKKTAIFSVPDDWKVTWSCKPSSFYGSQYNVQVYIYNSDGSLGDIAINELCKTGNTSGETEEHQSGSIYLEINSEGDWTIQIQELK